MSDWTLIYTNDENGTPGVGSVTALADAVRDGADVKIIYSRGSGVWWSRYCPSVSTRGSGAGRLVTATYMEAADTTDAGSGGGVQFATLFLIEYHIYNSNGVSWMHKGGNSERRTVAMRWYVRDYQPRLGILSTIRAAIERIGFRG